MKTSTIARRLRSCLYILHRRYGVTPDSVLGRDLDSVARHLEALPDLQSSAAVASPAADGAPGLGGPRPGATTSTTNAEEATDVR